MPMRRLRCPATFLFALGLGLSSLACGDLDDVTTIKDLRVLAIKAEPAGFLVDLNDPSSMIHGPAQLTALVVDPTGVGQEVVVTSALGCPDYLDTITAATGAKTSVCSTTPINLPDPTLAAALSSTPLVPDGGLAVPANPADGFTFQPTFQYGMTTAQLGLFFGPPTTGNATIDAALTNNRSFGLDGITSYVFTRGTQTAEAVKRVVYWPLLDQTLYPDQLVNQNPNVSGVTFYQHRNDMTGDPEDPYPDAVPELSLARGDQLYVLPAEDKPEEYVFYEKDHEMGGAIVAKSATELLRYSFFATAGTFSPAERRSRLSPFLTSKDGRVHLDSQYNPPKAKDLPADGNVTIWVVIHDERAGVNWFPTKIRVVP